MNELYEKLAEIIEVDSVDPDAVLKEFDTWDSLSILSLVAMLGSSYGVNVTAQDLEKINTAEELLAFVESKRG